MSRIYFDLTSPTPPKRPNKLPPSIQFLISNVPELMKNAAAQSVFTPLTVYMKGVDFVKPNGVLTEPADSEGVVGNSGIGKGFIDVLLEAVIRTIRTKDAVSINRLEEWTRICKSKGANQTKPERPADCAQQAIEADCSSAAFIQLLKDAERAGGLCLYTNVSELDMLDMMTGSHKKLSMLVRNSTDKGKTWGAQRATVDGVQGRPTLRWRCNFSTVPTKAVSFFKGCIPQGDLWRLGISYVLPPTQRKGSAPKQGKYDEAWYKQLDEILLRLSSATGVMNIQPCVKYYKKLREEVEEIADMTDSSTFDSMYHRSLDLVFIKGCLLYIMEGYRWSKQIEAFMSWSLSYDMWSKINVFAPELRSNEVCTRSDIRKYGPTNLLDLLPSNFDKTKLEELRVQLDKPSDATSQLHNWMMRGYITYCNTTGLYSKTENYLAKHKA